MKPRPLRYLALGDSYTIGEGVTAAQRWPAQLVAELRRAGLALESPHYLATTGWSSDELAAAIKAQDWAAPYDLVSLLIGVNDQYRGHPAEARRRQLSNLMQQAIELAGDARKVLVVSIPDWSTSPFAKASGRDVQEIARQLDSYNGLIQSLTAEAGCAWIDITACSRRYPEELATDGLHPSPAQYARWSALIRPSAWRRLQDAVTN